jgi:hypothetical protein
LTVANDSTVSGPGYFNVFPPLLLNVPPQSQNLTALVSAPTVSGTPTTITWNGGSGALELFAFAAGTSPDAATRTAVALGDIVTVDWAGGAFTFAPAPGGPATGIEVAFTPNVPVDTQIGLVVGPGSILVPRQANPSPLTLTPNLSPVATVTFGTAYQWPGPDVSDISKSQAVTFKPSSASPVLAAQITIGSDNLIVQNG